MVTTNIKLAVILLVFLPGCASAPSAAPSKYITIQGQDFRTGAAQQALLGSVGHYAFNSGTFLFERGMDPPYKDQPLIQTKVDDDDRRTIIATVKASAVKIPVGIEAGLNQDWERTATFHSLAFRSKQELVRFLNEPSNNEVLQFLLLHNKEARVITGTLVGYNYNEKNKLAKNAKVALDKLRGVVNVTVDANTTRERKIAFSDGTIVGYLYDRPCWTVDMSGNLKIADLITDNPSIIPDRNCPGGTYRDAKKATKNM